VPPALLNISEREALAIISDTHANRTALEAVLGDIRQRGVERVVMLGDVAGKGPSPAETVDALRFREIPCVFGNWDELLVRPLRSGSKPELPDMSPALSWQRSALGRERLEWLNALPYALDIPRAGGIVRLLHASSRGVWQRVRENDGLEKFYDLFSATPEVGLDAPTPLAVGYGDIHTTLLRHLRSIPEINPAVRGRMVFNVGSVGNPLDQPVPSYAILHGGDALEVSFVRVPYDNELECHRATQSDMPQLEEYLEETRTGNYRPRVVVFTP
jgi:diadenosine tetraphosphatase ApaH/serine/threonine PP2A family protein phosphatase